MGCPWRASRTVPGPPLGASSDIGIFVERPEPERLDPLPAPRHRQELFHRHGERLVVGRPSPVGSCPPLMTVASCLLRGTTSSPSADQRDSDPQVTGFAETDRASIHGYHDEGNASAFRFLTPGVHRLGRACRQSTSGPGETEPPPSL